MNFIFFNPDEMRASALGCYGNSAAHTPHTDRFAAEGTRFANCTAQSVLCSPSRCSLLTGWYPHVRGHRNLTHLLRPDEPNFLRALKRGGYDVVYYGKNDVFSPETVPQSIRLPEVKVPEGLKPVWNHPPESPYLQGDPRHHSFLFDPIGSTPEHALDTWKTNAAIEFLASKPKSPFALFLALEAPHPPYSAPQPFHDLIDPNELPPLLPPILEGKPDFHQKIRQYRGLEELDEASLRKIQAVYLGQTAFADSLFGKVLSTLENNGLAEDTCVVFFSDHGDYAGDYGLVEKWQTGMEDCLTQVPCIIRVPGARKGQSIGAPIELFDIMPTTLELAGISPEAPHFAKSQRDVLFGEAEAEENRAVFCEGGYSAKDWHGAENLIVNGKTVPSTSIYYPKRKMGDDHPETLRRTVMLREHDRKLIYRPDGLSELYDLAGDPGELENLWHDPAWHSERERLRERLTRWLVVTSDVIPFEADPRHFLPPSN